MVGGGASGALAGGRAALFGEFNYVPLGGTLGISVKQYMIGGGFRLYAIPKPPDPGIRRWG